MNLPLRIVVITSGWVVVGYVKQQESQLTICDSRCIRKWGTTKGLGQLALNGPTNETRLDETGIIMVPLASVVMQIETEASKWPCFN